MNFRFISILILVSCVVFSGSAFAESEMNYEFIADDAPAKIITLGSTDPESGFEFQLRLTSKGAAIENAVFANFDNCDAQNLQPLMILSPVSEGVFSMANREFVFVKEQLQLPLHRLNWKSFPVEKGADGSQKAIFEAVIKNKEDGQSIVKLTKTYKIYPSNYMLDCKVEVENLSPVEEKVNFNMTGPVGIGREGARADMRKVVAGFRDSKQQVTTVRLDAKKLGKAKTAEDRSLIEPGADFLWAATVNKYFAAILVPQPSKGDNYCNWLADKSGRFYNPDRDAKANTGDETVGLDLKIATAVLAPAGEESSLLTYNFQLYLGPKDKTLFDENPIYKNLGFFHTIDFMSCCFPAGVIAPMAFGILATMRWMYGFFGNYGVVIIILVFIIRIVIHPLTKKSQVSMSKMGKLAPKVEQIKKKYANNKAEMNKHVMAVYKENGASPIMGMLPMMVQMPIWIALYSAIYASIELRGAAFLPFWITNLSAPDALFKFPAGVTLPFIGDTFNLLPILLGVAFYMQQKLMPSTASASSNPQMAQQQKMMMFMMPLLFPLMLYKAPSGLNLYIMASTFAGVIEQIVIRKHIREKEEQESVGLVAVTSKTGGKVKKKKPKPFYKN
ncbi:MAG: YidC/Oxa1 family insertase periplasmic-domain containing protein [Planctomycetes bacterium]|nr:YidC/Oxa1 family insertase periplasmic-domain containing protein [Planctomycetota bacterium]